MVQACLPAVPLMSTVTDGLGSANEERLFITSITFLCPKKQLKIRTRQQKIRVLVN